MRREANVRAARSAYAIFSAFLCAFGIALILYPGFPVRVLTNAVGIILICFGIIKIWGRFSGDLYRLAFQNGLASGIFGIAVGITLLAKRTEATEVLGILLGITAFADALTKVEMCVDAHAFGLSVWKVILAAGVAAGVIGFLLILQPEKGLEHMAQLISVAILAEGILNLLTALTTIRVRRKMAVDADTQAYSVR